MVKGMPEAFSTNLAVIAALSKGADQYIVDAITARVVPRAFFQDSNLLQNTTSLKLFLTVTFSSITGSPKAMISEAI